ncbi:T9SS type A sorting domain-containing protein [Paraflavisolibacter sp. H34]|uniref:T9SS type A sorting domain-containing protein n=1 Tax=Huijunlia imazamoxiresistens TaxID=3127457 RepID=UPI0030175EC3
MKRFLFFFLCSLLLTSVPHAQVTLVPYKSTWKYLDNGSDQGTAWQKLSFNDAAWRSDKGNFGYGVEDVSTTLSFGPDKQNRYITHYFRKTFSVAETDLYNDFTASLQFDDGVVLYVNGTEVFRNNMPAGDVGHRTLATSSATIQKSVVLPKSVFVNGTNVLAVEVHQFSNTSADMLFDLKLGGNADETEPRVTAINRHTPTAGITNASSVTFHVAFSEKVSGVDVADFTVMPVSGTPGGTVSAVSAASADGTQYYVSVNGISGGGSLRLDLKKSGTGITDKAGNTALGFTGGQPYSFDRTPPVLIGINRQSPSSALTNATSLTYRVTFSEAMVNVQANDFRAVAADGSVSGAVTGVEPLTSNTYNVQVGSVNGNGSLRLDLRSNAGLTDIAGNHLAGGYTSGQTYTVDHIHPQVRSVGRLLPLESVTKAASVVYQVVFTEKVSDVGPDDFTVTTVSGTAKGIIASKGIKTSGTEGTTWEVTVSSVSGTGQLRLQVQAGGIFDGAGNDCYGFEGGEPFSVDRTAPRVLSIERYAPAAVSTNGSTVVYRAVFSEPVTGVDAADFALKKGSGSAKGVIEAGAVTAVGSNRTTYDVRVSTLSGSGDLRLDVRSSGTGIQDLVTNELSGGFSGGQTYTLDLVAPKVVSINRQLPTGTATNASQLTFRVSFSEAVTGVKPADFLTSTVSGTLTGMVAADGVVAAGAEGTDYDVTVSRVRGTGVLRLDLRTSGSAITDIATNALSGGFGTGQTYSVDQTRPTVLSILRQSPTADSTNISSIVWRVTFSEKMANLKPEGFTLAVLRGAPSGELTATGIKAVGSTGTVWDVEASAISTFSTLRLDVPDASSLTDAVGNTVQGGYTSGQTYHIDPPPMVVGVQRLAPSDERTNASAVTWRVTFTEGVTGVDLKDFTFTTLSGSSSGKLEADAVVPSDAKGAAYDVTVSNISTSAVIRLNLKSGKTGITDVFGTPLSDGPARNSKDFEFTGYKKGETYTIDKTAPLVQSINRQLPAGAITNGQSVTWRVTFSEAVEGLGPAAFVLTTVSGSSSGQLFARGIVPVGTTGTVYDVTAAGISGTGTLRLDLANTASVTDLVGNSVGRSFVTGQPYNMDYLPPFAASINRQKPTTEAAHGATATFRVLFNEPVAGVDASDFSITTLSGLPTGLLAPNAVVAVGSAGTTYDVTISGIREYATLRLDLNPSATAITDIAGNDLTGGFTTGQAFFVDPPPRVESITRQAPLSETAESNEITFRVVFSERVKNVDGPNFYATTLSGNARGTLALMGRDPLSSQPVPTVAPVGTDGKTWDVTVHGITGSGVLRLDMKESGTGVKDATNDPLLGGFTTGESFTVRAPASQAFTSILDLGPVPIAKNTADKPQGKVWTYANKWWSVLSTTSGTKLFRLDTAAWTPVLTLSNSSNVHADCRVAGNVTHILLFEPENDSYLVSVEYDAALGNYKQWSRRRDEVELDFGKGAESATLAIDSRNRMWIASAAKTDVNVRYSDPPYSNWSDTFHIEEGITDDDICAITTLQGKIGVLWSNQNTQRFGFKTHNDGADWRSWSWDESPASGQAQSKGNGFGDDHLNILCASDGTLYCAVKTSYDTPGYAKISLLVRNIWGGWSFYPVSSIEGTRGIVVLNEKAKKLKIIYGSKEEGGDIVYRESPLSPISFGPLKTLISGKFLFNEATSTHQPTNGEVVILATNQDLEPKLAVGVLARDEDSPSAAAASPQEADVIHGFTTPPLPANNLQAALSVYPNPAAGNVPVTVHFRLEQTDTYSLLLFDQQGAQLLELKKGRAKAGRPQTVSLDAGRFPKGVYLLRLQTARGSRTEQLIIE